MKKAVIAVMLLLGVACQSVKIKKDSYKTSLSAIELGSIGKSSKTISRNNLFETKAFPKLEEKIRLTVTFVPFTKQTTKVYQAKKKYNQNQNKLNYIDSLPVKPELVILQIADKLGYINELNQEYNNTVFTLLDNLQKTEVIAGVAAYLPNEDLLKLKQVDTYYLINNQEKKYAIVLYKQGKKTETIELSQNAIIGYQMNVFCWAQTERGKWYIADMVSESNSCMGKTLSEVSEKKREKNLFKM